MEIRKTDVLDSSATLCFWGAGWRVSITLNRNILLLYSIIWRQVAGNIDHRRKDQHMRTFCGWIGKDGMVRESHHYVKDPASVKRTMVAQSDKSWMRMGWFQ